MSKKISKKDIEEYILESEQWKEDDIICPYCEYEHKNEDSEFLYTEKDNYKFECKKCGSENLYLEPRIEGQDVMTADMVALKCKGCGSWLKWCPKDERQFYINKKQENKVEQCWVIQRDDGMYFCGWDLKNTACFTENIYRAICNTWSFFEFSPATERSCRIGIATHNLQNCRPVKCEIRVVGE